MNWIARKQLEIKHQRNIYRMPHVCDKCDTYEKPVRRMNTLVLTLIVFLGVGSGIISSNFLALPQAVLIGVFTNFIIFYQVAKRIKPECPKCYHPVRLPITTEELREIEKRHKVDETNSPLKRIKHSSVS